MIKREKILQKLMERFGQTIRYIHISQAKRNFPFDNIKLNRSEIMILFFLINKRLGVSPKELAILLRVTPGATTQFINALISKKLVERQVNKEDKRMISIKLSAQAKRKINKFKKDYFRKFSLAFDSFELKEIVEFTRLLEKIKINK